MATGSDSVVPLFHLVVGASDAIEMLMAKISDAVAIPPEELRLFLTGVSLAPERSAVDCGLRPGSTVRLVHRFSRDDGSPGSAHASGGDGGRDVLWDVAHEEVQDMPEQERRDPRRWGRILRAVYGWELKGDAVAVE
eukprot:2356132-Lingulodinium_polyedra.AAC.1